MNHLKNSAGKQAKQNVADAGVNAAMAPQNDWEEVDQGQVLEVMKEESISKAVISMLNVLKGNATPAEKLFCKDVVNAQGILISFEPMKTNKKKKGLLSKLFGSKPKVSKNDPKLAKAVIKNKLSLYLQSPDVKKAVLHDRLLMARLMQDAKHNSEIRELFDNIYSQVGEVMVLMQLIKARFGVSLIDNSAESFQSLDTDIQDNDEVMNYLSKRKSGNPLAWSAEALKSIYKTYINIPAQDLANIKFIMHTSDTNPSSVSYNSEGASLGVYEVNYIKGDEHLKLDHRRNNIDKNDMDNDKEIIPIVTAHELGHVVDHTMGNLSGANKNMRKVSSWVEVRDDPDAVLSYMEGSIAGTPYGGLLNASELRIAHDVAKAFLQETKRAVTGTWEDLKSKYEGRLRNSASKVSANVDMEKVISVILDKSIDSNVLYHCWRGRSENLACFNFDDQIRGMNRPFHQGYKGKSWYSFDKSRWSDKISQYQYRDPIEEFAETYASFHAAPALGKKKGEMTPKPLLQWFISEGLDRQAPNKVKGSSNIPGDNRNQP